MNPTWSVRRYNCLPTATPATRHIASELAPDHPYLRSEFPQNTAMLEVLYESLLEVVDRPIASFQWVFRPLVKQKQTRQACWWAGLLGETPSNFKRLSSAHSLPSLAPVFGWSPQWARCVRRPILSHPAQQMFNRLQQIPMLNVVLSTLAELNIIMIRLKDSLSQVGHRLAPNVRAVAEQDCLGRLEADDFLPCRLVNICSV